MQLGWVKMQIPEKLLIDLEDVLILLFMNLYEPEHMQLLN